MGKANNITGEVWVMVMGGNGNSVKKWGIQETGMKKWHVRKWSEV